MGINVERYPYFVALTVSTLPIRLSIRFYPDYPDTLIVPPLLPGKQLKVLIALGSVR